MEQGPFDTLHIIIRDGGPEIVLVDDMVAPAAPDHPIAEMRVTIHVRALVTSVRGRLDELAVINAEDGPPARVRKRGAPAQKRRERVEAR